MALLMFFLIVGASWQTGAVVSCYQPAIPQIAGPQAVVDQVLKIAIIGDEDRRTLKDFAKDSGESERVISQRYSASGELKCDDWVTQASVVLKGDLILVSGHGIYKSKDCEKAYDLKDCKAYFVENGKKVAYDIAKEEAEGFTCPDSSTMKSSNDWAILRLKRPVSPAIKPYAIKSAPCASEESPTPITFIGKSADFKASGLTQFMNAPRHYGRCKILSGICGKPAYPIMTSDCDSDHGSSGGGAFIGEVEPQLVGILAGMRNTCPASQASKRGPYNEKCWSSTIVPIAGELQDKLERLAHE